MSLYTPWSYLCNSLGLWSELMIDSYHFLSTAFIWHPQQGYICLWVWPSEWSAGWGLWPSRPSNTSGDKNTCLLCYALRWKLFHLLCTPLSGTGTKAKSKCNICNAISEDLILWAYAGCWTKICLYDHCLCVCDHFRKKAHSLVKSSPCMHWWSFDYLRWPYGWTQIL